MQLLGKNFFGKDDNEEALGEMMREKHLLSSPAQEQEQISPNAVSLLKKAVHDHENAWYRRAWRGVRENRKHLIVAASVLVIGAAVYFNWYLYRADSGAATKGDAISQEEQQALDEAMKVQKDTGSDYFAVSQINRERARDEAMEVLQTVIDGNASQEAVDDAMTSMAQIAGEIESEGEIEALVMSKGFENCVAVVSGETASVIVKTDGLMENEVAQIQEIVYETAGILPANLKIIEK